MSGPRDRMLPVEGGALAVAEWGDEAAPPLLAIHGITASSRAWLALARLLPDQRVIAPDLRGRARSGALPGPFGLRRHVDDLRRLLDDLDTAPLPVVGHSMGAFVAVLLAAAEPERVSRLVLIDGGLPLAMPDGVDPQALLAADPAALLGPVYARLTRVFPTREDYADYWRAHPALADAITDDVLAYADYDLDEVDGGVRPSADPDAVASDQRELFGPDWYLDALRAVRQPALVLRAPLGLQAEPPGLYAPGALEGWRRDLPQLEVLEVPDVNHYTVLMTRPGADRVADAVRSGRPAHPPTKESPMQTVLDGITAHDVPTGRLRARVLERPGDGPVVVFVHGNVSSSLFFQPLMLALPSDLRALAIDLRGFGESETLPVDATRGVRDFSDDVAAVLDALGTGPVHLVGWSMGAGVVLQTLLDRGDLVRSVTLESPVSPYGFGGTALDGSILNSAAGSGGGGANPAFVAALDAGDRGDGPTSPRTVYRTAYVAHPESIDLEDLWVESMLTTRTGPDNYPGDAATTDAWPGFAPGTTGVLNTMTPDHLDLTGIVDLAAKPAVLWIRGEADAIVSDASFFDLNTLGQAGVVPGWPGAEVAPPQPMVAQTRAVLDRYAASGGSYRELALPDTGHSPHLERPREFAAALVEHVRAADPA